MTPRPRCMECRRPLAHCLCASITPIDHRTEVLILQHPRERSHPFNTARLAERCLRGAELLVDHGGRLQRDEGLRDRMEGFGLLYPGPDAKDLSLLPPEERPKKLVVIDGTWHHARAMYRDIAPLQDLPKFTLPAGGVSGFMIRKQPEEYCLSTLEALHSALRCLEPDTPGLDLLLEPFAAMQRTQLGSKHAPTPRINKRRKKTQGPVLPEVFGDRFESLVVAYGEVSPIRCEDVRPYRKKRPLLTFAAERPATGERIMRVLEHPLQGDERWNFLRLSPEEAASPVSGAELEQAFGEFRRPGDVLTVWNQGTFEHLRSALPDLGETLLLKSVYCNQRPYRGMLEEVVAMEELMEPQDVEYLKTRVSRTEERLANAVAVAKRLALVALGSAALGCGAPAHDPAARAGPGDIDGGRIDAQAGAPTYRLDVHLDAAQETARLVAVIEGPGLPRGEFGLLFQEYYAFVTLTPPLQGDLTALGDGRPLMVERADGGFQFKVGPGAKDRIELEWTVGLDHRSHPDVIAAADEYEHPYLDGSHGMLFTAALIPMPDFPLGQCVVSFSGDHAGDVIAPWPVSSAGSGGESYLPSPMDLADDVVLLGPGWSTVESSAGGLVGTFAMVPGALWLKPLVEERLVPVIEAELELFGRAPRDRYLFAFGPSGEAVGYGGSPKSGAMTLFVSPELDPSEARRGVTHLVAHEFFHTWAKGHCVLEDDLRFVDEGFTDYYAYVVPWRLGFFSDADLHAVLERKLAEGAAALESYGDSLTSAGGEPFFSGGDAYQACYSAGLVLALWTDLALRSESGKTLDDWMGSLYNDPLWAGVRRPGLGDLEERLGAHLAAGHVTALMDAATGGEPIDWEGLFDLVGLPVERIPKGAGGGPGRFEISPTVVDRLQAQPK